MVIQVIQRPMLWNRLLPGQSSINDASERINVRTSIHGFRPALLRLKRRPEAAAPPVISLACVEDLQSDARASAAEQIEQEQDNCYYQQCMDQTAANVCDESEQPKDNQQCNYCVKHNVLQSVCCRGRLVN